jgi:SWI/SNF-related matrix-associated actin-dependent regulator 1 of chromatin subfamily A
MAQAEDRAHRIGQKNSVNIYYLHAKNTIDDLIFEMLQKKSLVTTSVTNGYKESM